VQPCDFVDLQIGQHVRQPLTILTLNQPSDQRGAVGPAVKGRNFFDPDRVAITFKGEL
jgi:hypothetical protein